jgi:phage protein D
MAISQPMQTRLKILFTEKGIDVTKDITADLISFSYEDKENLEADEITIRLKDESGKWAGNWRPDGGETIKAYLLPGDTQQATGRLYCGKFYVADITISGAPRTCEIKAVSIPLNTPIRRRLRTKAWEKKDLQGIAAEIAKNHNLSLVWESEINPEYDRQEQSRASDLNFLLRLCEEAGCSVKVTDKKLVVFDQSVYEKKTPIKTLTLGRDYIESWSFSFSQDDTYKSCVIKYRDPKTRELNTFTYTDPEADENGQEYSMKIRAQSIDEAKRLAKAKLRKLQLRKVTGSLTVVGDHELLAGSVIRCKGFGSIDGNFIIEKANHIVSNGYTTSVDLRRVNSNF